MTVFCLRQKKRRAGRGEAAAEQWTAAANLSSGAPSISTAGVSFLKCSRAAGDCRLCVDTLAERVHRSHVTDTFHHPGTRIGLSDISDRQGRIPILCFYFIFFTLQHLPAEH